jgi:hypothetical protein
MQTPMKDKLLSVRNDPTARKEQRNLAADILGWYASFDIPSESDKGVVATLAEFYAECFWKGILTIADHDARGVRPA